MLTRRCHSHFTPAGSSRLNLVERPLADLSPEVIRDGSCAYVRELGHSIQSRILQCSVEPKVHRCKTTLQEILRQIERAMRTGPGSDRLRRTVALLRNWSSWEAAATQQSYALYASLMPSLRNARMAVT